jgi:hypothetical protein
LYLEDKDVPDNKKQKCPLTNMITNEQVTCDCLTRLLTQGQQTLAAAGVSATAKVPLWVKATGGVRKRKMEEQVEILEKTERCLTSAEHYSWQRAEAIGGSTEALYAWLAINYARKTLQPKRTLGIVEIGGESAQIAFEVPGAIAPNQRGSVVAVPLSSGNMYVYAHSDVLGKDAAIAALDGKTPRSVPIPDCGVADKIGRCETKIDKFICPHPDGKEPCSQRSPQFPPDGISFIGLSNFKHVVRNIKVDKPLLSAARDRARQMCGPDSEMIKLRDKYITVKGDYRQDVCLDILYMSRVATYAWGLTLPAVTAADDTDPEWPLGAMFMQIAQSTNKTAR